MSPHFVDNKYYFLALNRLSGIGPKTVQRLLTRWPRLADCFNLSATSLADSGLPNALAQAIAHYNEKAVHADLRWEQASARHHLLTWDHPSYPPLLKEIYDPPVVLYAIGDLNTLQQKTIAMVGTRNPSYAARDIAYQFAAELAQHSITVVSGLARGIDGQAHAGCLDSHGKTIAVLGTGIDRIYPYQHRNLAEKIKENGLIFSEFPLGTPPIAGHFPRRNRIISGLSLATLVVEAAIKSGSLITARFALDQNREVMAVPGAINNHQAKGCHYMLQQGATLITCVKDIIEALGLEHSKNPVFEKLSLAIEDENLVNCLSFEVTTLNQIMTRTGLSFEKVAETLAMLELRNIIKAVPGGYMRCGL